MNELKDCPFCGGNGRLYGTDITYVACEGCRIETPSYSQRKYAVTCWNRRIDNNENQNLEEASFQRIKELEKKVCALAFERERDKRLEALELAVTQIKAKLQYLGKGWGEDA